MCLNREPTYDEKMKLIELVRKYTAKNVLEALNHLYEKALNESPEIVVTSHKRGKPDSLHITLEACEKLLWQRKMGLDKPMPRRTEPVKGWKISDQLNLLTKFFQRFSPNPYIAKRYFLGEVPLFFCQNFFQKTTLITPRLFKENAFAFSFNGVSTRV